MALGLESSCIRITLGIFACNYPRDAIIIYNICETLSVESAETGDSRYSVTWIGNYAFSRSGLVNVFIPSSVCGSFIVVFYPAWGTQVYVNHPQPARTLNCAANMRLSVSWLGLNDPF